MDSAIVAIHERQETDSAYYAIGMNNMNNTKITGVPKDKECITGTKLGRGAI
jgi:hypothetical protein